MPLNALHVFRGFTMKGLLILIQEILGFRPKQCSVSLLKLHNFSCHSLVPVFLLFRTNIDLLLPQMFPNNLPRLHIQHQQYQYST